MVSISGVSRSSSPFDSTASSSASFFSGSSSSEPGRYFRPTPAEFVARQASLLKSIDVADTNMTDYGTALSPGQNAASNAAKASVQALWDSAFSAPDLAFLPSKASLKGAKLKVAIIGGGIAGSTFALAAARRGHDVALLEMRSKLPSRENLVTVNGDSRKILTRLLAESEQNSLFQTKGDLGFSERAPLHGIETALQKSALEAGDNVVLRGVNIKSVERGSDQKASVLFNQTNTEGETHEQRLDDVDLVVVASGAKSASPYGKSLGFINENFSNEGYGLDQSALCFAKYRFPAQAEQTPTGPAPSASPSHLEINRHRPDPVTGSDDISSFVNMYTGKTLQVDGQPHFETSLLFNCPPALASPKNSDALDNELQYLAKGFTKDKNPQVKQLGQAMQHSPDKQIQQGVALVSHWMADKAYSSHLPMIIVGDAAAPAHPWTGSGANIAMKTVEPFERLLDDMSLVQPAQKTKALGAAFAVFEAQSQPLRMQSLLRGLFASAIFSKGVTHD